MLFAPKLSSLLDLLRDVPGELKGILTVGERFRGVNKNSGASSWVPTRDLNPPSPSLVTHGYLFQTYAYGVTSILEQVMTKLRWNDTSYTSTLAWWAIMRSTYWWSARRMSSLRSLHDVYPLPASIATTGRLVERMRRHKDIEGGKEDGMWDKIASDSPIP